MAVVCTICGGKSFVNENALRQHSLENQKHRQREAQLRAQQTRTPAVPARQAVPARVATPVRAATTPVRTATAIPVATPAPVAAATPVRAASSVALASSSSAVITPKLQVLSPAPAPALAPVSVPVTVLPAAHEHWCKLCKLDFPSEAALQHHYKNDASPWHPKCLRCHEGFQNHELLDGHRRTAHPMTYCATCTRYVYDDDMAKHIVESDNHKPFACTPCSKRFATEELLKKHWKDDKVSWHPRCTHCGEGFENSLALEAHLSAAHTFTFCDICARNIYGDDLHAHWKESPNHPNCPHCGAGFESQETFLDHALEEHADFCCRPCSLAFVTFEGIASHLAMPDGPHPRCVSCGSGFRDDDDPALDEERVDEQHVCPNVQASTSANEAARDEAEAQSSEETSPSDGYATGADSDWVMPAKAPSLEDADHVLESESKTSSRSSEEATSPSSGISTPKSDVTELQRPSPADEPQDSPAPAARERASSEPPPLSATRPFGNMFPSPTTTRQKTWHDATDRVAVASQGAEDAEETKSDGSESSSQTSSPSSATTAPRLSPQMREQEAISPIASLPRSVLSRSPLTILPNVGEAQPREQHEHEHEELTPRDVRRNPFFWNGSSLASESTSPPVSAHAEDSRTSNKSNGNGRGLMYALQHAREMLAGRSASRGSSRSNASSRSGKYGNERSRADSHATPSTTSRTRVSREGSGHVDDPDSSKPRLPSPPPTLPMPRLSWHCRVCSGAPREPTVTMCGHLFCRSCIVMELTKYGQCPVCRAAVLVRLQVE